MLVNPRSLVLTPDDGTCLIEFRIEKVSRRKDGQRFRLFVEPFMAPPTAKQLAAGAPPRPALPPLSGVFSDPINVLSKRKTGERAVARRPARPVVDLPDESTATLKLLHGTLLQASNAIQQPRNRRACAIL